MEPALADLIATLAPDRAFEAQALIALCSAVSGFRPRVAGSGIIGFGRYAYRYPSGHSGTAPVIAFAPRKTELVLYPSCTFDNAQDILSRIGRHRLGKGCLYLKRLSDADPAALSDLFQRGMAEIAALWPVTAD